MKILSWNVNGLRAVQKKGFASWLKKARPDILCVQESRALPEQVEPDWPKTYEAHWNPAEKKGYAGVITFSKTPPIKITQTPPNTHNTQPTDRREQKPSF